MGEQSSIHQPVTYDRCAHVKGPFYHGAKSALGVGAELVPGYGSTFQQGRTSNNIYFTALVETAAWGAELATLLAGSGERGQHLRRRAHGPVRGRSERDQQAIPRQPHAVLPDASHAARRRRAGELARPRPRRA